MERIKHQMKISRLFERIENGNKYHPHNIYDSFQINDVHEKHKNIDQNRTQGLTIDMPSIWSYIILLKLNSAHSVAKCINYRNKFSGIIGEPK